MSFMKIQFSKKTNKKKQSVYFVQIKIRTKKKGP